MISSRSTIFCLFHVFLTVAYGDIDLGNMIKLCDNNFEETVLKHEHMLIIFYSESCDHCKELMPNLVAVDNIMREKNHPFSLAVINGAECKTTEEKYVTTGYPTILYFNQNVDDYQEYKNGREIDDFILYINKKLGDLINTVTVKHLLNTLQTKSFVVVAYFKVFDNEYINALKVYASTHESTIIYHVKEDLSTSNIDISDEGIYVIKKFDEPIEVYKSEISVEAVSKFVEFHRIPHFVIFDMDLVESVFQSGINHHFTCFIPFSHDKKNNSQEILKKLSPDYHAEIIFLMMNTEDEKLTQVIDHFGIQKDELKCMILKLTESSLIPYHMDKMFETEDEIKNFIKDFRDGKISKFIKSAELEDDWDATNIKQFVGSNLKPYLLEDSNRHVFIMFYAPWCGHCEKFQPILQDIADEWSTRKDHSLVFGKIDSTKNDAHVDIKGYPTLILFKNGKQEIVYDGSRDKESVTAFLESNLSGEDTTKDEDGENVTEKKKEEL
ncbi:Protein disulfide-isomerase [Intoshia linei]|uniref:Protein disulfide-isomerase n=1 Tax=Intoshia linei TaxID=1819745 RepID=A0A177AWT6_9BILA|nr:Protein disulfide-isomerase [Intoshia linei]